MVVRNILVLLWGSLLLFSCEKNGGPDAEGQIRGLMDDYLEALRDSMGVDSLGVGLYLLSADRDMYVSAGFPAEYGSDIHFRVASNSKTFTAAAVLRLHEAGLLDIDDVLTDTIPGTAQRYLPEGSAWAVPNAERISLRLLLQHRGGVFDVTNADIPAGVPAPYAGQRYTDYVKETQGETHTFRFEELIGVVAEHGLSTGQPDVEFAYSNTGYNILGLVVERVSGLRLHEYLEREFFEPLGLAHTYSPHLGTDRALPAPAVASYLRLGGEVYRYDLDNVSSAVSEGQIVSRPGDLARWARALYGTEAVLSTTTRAMMLDVLPADAQHGYYGLGVQAFPEDLGHGHDGARPGYLSVMRYIPETGTALVIFTNHIYFENPAYHADALYELLRDSYQTVKP